MDVDSTTDIVSRGKFDGDNDSAIITPFVPNALPPSENCQELIPIETLKEMVPVHQEYVRAQKRYRIQYEQDNAELETPATYSDAMRSTN